MTVAKKSGKIGPLDDWQFGDFRELDAAMAKSLTRTLRECLTEALSDVNVYLDPDCNSIFFGLSSFDELDFSVSLAEIFEEAVDMDYDADKIVQSLRRIIACIEKKKKNQPPAIVYKPASAAG